MGSVRPVGRFIPLLLLVLMVVCGGGVAHGAVLKVAVSIHPLALLVEELGGERVDVTTLLPPGASPHNFDLSPVTARRLAAARLFVTVGSGLDAWADKAARVAVEGRARLVLSDHVSLLQTDHGHRHGVATLAGDPHFWLDPLRVRDQLLPMLVSALSAAAPTDADYFAQSAAAFAERLTALDRELADGLAPYRDRAFIAFHGSWGYFTARYGLRQVGVVEPAPGREPSARQMAQLVGAARKEGATAILIEPQFSPRIARTVAGQFKGRVILADPLGRPGTPSGDSYAALMRFNLAAFIRALSR